MSHVETQRGAPDRYSLERWKPIHLDDLVRLGRDHDGGYVITRRSLAAVRALVSIGINDDWSFEAAFAEARPDAAIVGVDGSVSYEVFYDRWANRVARVLPSLLLLRPKSAATHWRSATQLRATAKTFRGFFARPNRSFHQRYLADTDSASCITWSRLLQIEPLLAAGPSSPDLLVKIDIEGAEYRVLQDVAATGRRIAGLVVEFHSCDLLWERFVENMELLEERFAVAHIHGNNYAPLIRDSSTPRVLEISFVSRELLGPVVLESSQRYPVPGLDQPCDPTTPDHSVRF